MYKTIEMFTDLQDNGYKYNVDDLYPRMGYKPTPERIKSLASVKNKRKRAVITEVPEIAIAEKPKLKKTGKKTN